MSYFNSTCFKKENIRKVKGWKIVDKNYKEQKYKNLFTFQILPVLAMRKSMQDIWGCDGECDKEAQMQRCEKMFVKFSNQDFKLLVPFNQNKKTIEQTKRQTKTFGQFENISTTLILVSSIIILIVSTVCCSICLFLSNISNEGEGKTENL
ncbi:unnamed protein product [Meloidogyne enterolobii]|uniref:Uncharacterized protein n=1 Tax=Meloidogyne enterolobii TaxID=390850 RepID=A0ACB0ZGI9_MELEN